MATPALPLHQTLGNAIHQRVQRASPRFSYYLHERGLQPYIAAASPTQLEETMVLGEVLLDACLVEYMFGKDMAIRHIGTVKTQLSNPAVYNALLQCESSQFQRYPPDCATPLVIVKIFVGALTMIFDFEETKAWYRDALGPAVVAAAAICDEHVKMFDVSGPAAKKGKTTERERFLADLTLAAQALTSSPASNAVPFSADHSLAPVGCNGQSGAETLVGISGRIARSWWSSISEFSVAVAAVAQAEYEVFMSTAFPEEDRPVLSPIEEITLGVSKVYALFKQPQQQASPEFMRSTAPSPATPARRRRRVSEPSPTLLIQCSRPLKRRKAEDTAAL